ncbi:zinc-ribbon domain-containing protein, partial [Roseibium sp.]
MKIKCPDCSTSYDIKPQVLGDQGRSVKCARCGNRWFVSPKQEPEDEDLPLDEEPEDEDAANWAADGEEEDRESAADDVPD